MARKRKTRKTDKKEQEGVHLVALRNTYLADGTFVKEGSEVVVSEAYAKVVESESNPHFKIVHHF